MQKQDNLGENSRVIVDSTKSQIDFKNFMKKLLNYEV
jgi:phosphate starvation-inducible protein PhoH